MDRFSPGFVLLAALLLAAAPHAVNAQQQQQQQQQPSQPQAESEVMALSVEQIDPNFIRAAAQAGLAEVQVSQLAAQQAKGREVVDFAEQMVQDHSQANEELLGIAQQHGTEPPQGLNAKQLMILAALEGQTGDAFDEAYLRGQIRDHEEAILLYRFMAENGLDEQLRGFAERALPMLEEHLERARTLAQQLGIES